MNIVNSLFLFILDVFSSVLSIIFKPIDLLLCTIIPNYSIISDNVISLFSYFRDSFLFIINWIHIPNSCLSLIVGYITFRVALFFGTLTYKLALKWFHYLKM